MNSERTREERAAFARLRAGDPGARAEIAERHLPLVRHLARRFAGGRVAGGPRAGRRDRALERDRPLRPRIGQRVLDVRGPDDPRRDPPPLPRPHLAPAGAALAQGPRARVPRRRRRVRGPRGARAHGRRAGGRARRRRRAGLGRAAGGGLPASRLARPAVRHGDDDAGTLHEMLAAEDDALGRADAALSLGLLTSRLGRRATARSCGCASRRTSPRPRSRRASASPRCTSPGCCATPSTSSRQPPRAIRQAPA